MLANRLSENPDNQVLLLEAGGNDLHPYVGMPKGMAKLVQHPRFTWRSLSSNQENLDCPQARSGFEVNLWEDPVPLME